MKLRDLCDDATSVALRFDWLREKLQPLSEFGRAHFEQLHPFGPGEEAAASRHARHIAGIARTADAELLDSIREALRQLPDVGGSLARARLGDILSDAELFLMLEFCEVAARLATLVQPTILADGLTMCTELADSLALGKSGKFGFYLADAFDHALADSRRELNDAQAEFDRLRGELSERVAGALGRQEIATDEFIVMRDDLAGALPKGVRVVREAPTYYLCELELDAGILKALERRDRCSAAVAQAEENVRKRLSSLIAKCSDILEQSTSGIARVDTIVAAARFAQHYRCVAPTYVEASRAEFIDGRFSPLEAELVLKGRPYVPVSLTLSESNVLTGPNMGGKSAALRTTGFIVLCAAFGVPVPAASASVALFARVRWLGVDAEAKSDGELLSSFGSEIVRLRELLSERRESALILIDEFARTTAPDEACALLGALLRRLQDAKTCTLVATHLNPLETDERTTHLAVRGLRSNGVAPEWRDTEHALQALAQRMDYRIERVAEAPAGASDALEVAAWLGLDKELLQTAKEMLARCSR